MKKIDDAATTPPTAATAATAPGSVGPHSSGDAPLPEMHT
tara:strand:- start:178 stop:297 length:120 start_codon:yes stop_codon:yes gene_type:complete